MRRFLQQLQGKQAGEVISDVPAGCVERRSALFTGLVEQGHKQPVLFQDSSGCFHVRGVLLGRNSGKKRLLKHDVVTMVMGIIKNKKIIMKHMGAQVFLRQGLFEGGDGASGKIHSRHIKSALGKINHFVTSAASGDDGLSFCKPAFLP